VGFVPFVRFVVYARVSDIIERTIAKMATVSQIPTIIM
jgi:hypothetical protein